MLYKQELHKKSHHIEVKNGTHKKTQNKER